MKTESKKMYPRVAEGMLMAHFNDKLTACVNTQIASCFKSSFEGQRAGFSRAVEHILRSPDFDRNAQIHPLCIRTIANGKQWPSRRAPSLASFHPRRPEWDPQISRNRRRRRNFSVVIELIADLDRAQEGVLRVSQQALLDGQRSMNTPGP
jgi:hypothetical protein